MRETPKALDSERFLLGAAMIDHEAAERVATAPEGFFWDARHSALHMAVSSVHRSGATVEPLSVKEALTALKIGNTGLDVLILEIAMENATSANFAEYWRIVTEAYRRRTILKALGAATEAAYALDVPIVDIVSAIETGVFAACQEGDGEADAGRLLMPAEYVAQASREFSAATMGTMTGIATGVGPWDDLIGRLRPGTLNVLAARPGVGKSMLALQAAKACGKWVAFFSMEMLAVEQVERMIAARMPEIDSEALRNKSVWVSKGDEIKKIMHELRGSKIMISDASHQTIHTIAKHCRRKKKDGTLDLIVVDFLQLCQSETKRGENRAQIIGQISKGLKLLANELRVPLLAIASMSRNNEGRDDKRPMLSDLKESGEIESDAHTVTFLYRNSDYKKNTDKEFENVIELIVKKNRGGRKGTRLLQFDGAASTFYDLTDEDKRRYDEYIKGNNTESDGPKIPGPKKLTYQGW